MVTIRQQLAPQSVVAAVTYSGASRNVGITFHETANRAVGANAAAHANLQARGNSRDASWNWQVDDKEAVQSFLNSVRTWHAGAGSAGDGDDTVAIEVCVNADGDLRKAWENAIELAIHLRKNGVGPGLFQHHDWSGKNCPTLLRGGQVPGLTWSAVVSRIKAGNATPVSNPIPKPKPPAPKKDEVTVNVTIGKVRKGDRGPDVRLLQGVLNVHGAGVAAGVGVLVEDGVDGDKTDRALRAHQKAHGIAVDGVAGADSWRTLLEDVPA